MLGFPAADVAPSGDCEHTLNQISGRGQIFLLTKNGWIHCSRHTGPAEAKTQFLFTNSIDRKKNTEVLKQTNTCREILVRYFLANEIAILGWEEVMV